MVETSTLQAKADELAGTLKVDGHKEHLRTRTNHWTGRTKVHMAIKLILLLTSLLSADLALAQAGLGAGRIPVTIPAFLLTIGDSVFTGAEPALEHTEGQISFTLNVDIFSDATNIPKTVMVCTSIAESCTVLPNFGPHAALKGVVNVKFPSVGATVQMTVCEDVGHICGKTLCTAEKPISLSASYGFLVTSVTVFHTRAYDGHGVGVGYGRVKPLRTFKV
jgi:hypothetical protein